MDTLLDTLWISVLRRWYVVAFFVCYLVMALRHVGRVRTLGLLVLGYAIAWASEASSIRNGFPYGLYRYLWRPWEPTGLDPREPALLGVPVFDSLSYVFIAYAAWCMSAWILRARAGRWPVWLAATVLFMTADVVTDPVALQGASWFLGRIYEYPGGGGHFGVPVTNYLGWWLVGVLILGAFAWLDARLPAAERARGGPGPGALLYLSILGFTTGVAAAIGLSEIALSNVAILMPLLALAAARAALERSARAGKESGT